VSYEIEVRERVNGGRGWAGHVRDVEILAWLGRFVWTHRHCRVARIQVVMPGAELGLFCQTHRVGRMG
jgi:hypothetical protein